MQDTPADWAVALSTAHNIVNDIMHRNPITNAVTELDVNPGIEDGTVTLDVTAANRRVLSLTLPGLESTFQTLQVPGGEITLRTGIKHGTKIEVVPAGVYRVDQSQIGYTTSGQIQITCPDRYLVIQRAGMGVNRSSVPGNTVWQEIQRLVEGAFTSTYAPFPGWQPGYPDKTATTKVGPQVYDSGDRAAVIQQYCTDNGLEFFFNASGLAVLRPIPTAAGPSVYTISVGQNGVLLDGTRTRDLSVTKNVIVLTTTATDVSLQAVEVANVNSPISDPLSSLGPLGRQVMDYSGNFRTTDQMTAAGKALLKQYSAVQQQIQVTTIPNAALDGWDCFDLILPVSDLGTRPVEQHVLQSTVLPLTASGTQTITGRQAINP